MDDRGTLDGATTETTANLTTEAGTSSGQTVVEPVGADITGVRTILVVMGVSGSGKTTIAKALADQLGWAFEEGDDLHPASDITKMHSGHPLDDRDRWPWLEKVADWIDGWRQAGKSGVITCSALKRSYRDFLARGRPDVRLLYLHGDIELIAARLTARKGHFMPASLLDSQLATLEEPDPDEHPIYADVGRPVERHRCRDCTRSGSTASEKRPDAERRHRFGHQIRPAAGHRGLCIDRRLHDRRSRRSQWLHRLAVLATFRQQCLFRSSARHVRARAMADLPGRPCAAHQPRLPRRHHGAGDDLRYRRWPRRRDRFHAGRPGKFVRHPSGGGAPRQGGDAIAPDAALRLRHHGALGDAARGQVRPERNCRAEPGGVAYAGRAAGRRILRPSQSSTLSKGNACRSF